MGVASSAALTDTRRACSLLRAKAASHGCVGSGAHKTWRRRRHHRRRSGGRWGEGRRRPGPLLTVEARSACKERPLPPPKPCNACRGRNIPRDWHLQARTDRRTTSGAPISATDTIYERGRRKRAVAARARAALRRLLLPTPLPSSCVTDLFSLHSCASLRQGVAALCARITQHLIGRMLPPY